MGVYLALQFSSTLIALSVQLENNLTANQEFLSPVQNPTIAFPFISLPPSTIRIMSLWFCGLVVSLVVEVLAILVKQWL